jgi:hypothetical protein
MTESEWLACDAPQLMLNQLQIAAGQRRSPPSARKCRLFACACCRRAWGLLGAGCRDYLSLAERVADGAADAAGLISVAWDRAEAERDAGSDPVRSGAARAACYAGCPTAAYAADYAPRSAQEAVAEQKAERKAQAALMRCVFGNPFRPVTPDPSWRTSDAVRLGQAVYDERILPVGQVDPVGLAALSDALEEAGCADADVLGHLRGPGPHVRGCWAIDLLLGKR